MISLLLFGSVALAQTPEDENGAEDDGRARELFQNGSVLYEEGRYEDAIAAWQEAYRLSERPLLLFNMANAYERMGQIEEALDALNRYRAFAPAEEREVLDRRMRNIEQRLEEEPESVPKQVAEIPAKPTSPTNHAPLVWIGAGATAAGGGLVFAALAQKARKETEELCVVNGDALMCRDDAQSALNRDKTYSLLADVSFGLAAVGISVGTITFMQQQGELSATPIPGGGNLTLGLRF